MNDANFILNQTGLAVTTTLGQIGSPIVLNGGGRYVSIAIKNTGANAFTHLSIYRQFVPAGDWIPWLVDTDFATATSKCSASGGTSGNAPNTLAAGQYAWLDVDCGLVNAIAVWAQAGTATSANIVGASRRQG